MQLSEVVGQHQPGGVHVQQSHTPLCKEVQEFDYIEVVDHGVGRLDECLGQQLFAGHIHAVQVSPTRRGAIGAIRGIGSVIGAGFPRAAD